jgi:hypothetical protein
MTLTDISTIASIVCSLADDNSQLSAPCGGKRLAPKLWQRRADRWDVR